MTCMVVTVMLAATAFGSCMIGRKIVKIEAIKAGVAEYYQPTNTSSATVFRWKKFEYLMPLSDILPSMTQTNMSITNIQVYIYRP